MENDSSFNNSTLVSEESQNTIVNVSSDLSDVTLNIQVDSLTDICNSWKQTISLIDLSSFDIKSIYSPLNDCDIATQYIPSLNNAINKVSSLALSICDIIQDVVDHQLAIDSETNSNDTGNNNNDSINQNTTTSNNNNNNNNYVPMPSTSIDNSNVNLTINSNLINNINKLDYISFSALMTTLAELSKSGISLNTYFNNNSYADILKETLINTNNISSDIRSIISEMDPNILQITLKSLFFDNNIITDVSKSVVYNYLESIASSKNTSVLSLLNSDYVVTFFNDIRDLSSCLNQVVGSNNINDNLLNIYDGNQIQNTSSNSISMIRSAIDILAKKNNINTEELLSNPSNRNYLTNEFSNMAKSISFINTLGSMDMNTFLEIMKGVLD